MTTASALQPTTWQDDCDHGHREIRAQVVSNGVRQFREQCLECGEMFNFLKKTDPRIMLATEIPPVDEALRERTRERRNRFWMDRANRVQQERAAQNDAWWTAYNAYLLTPAWRSRRQRVLERDQFICQACLQARAAQVHHLTYDHVGNEPLFELVSICDGCHSRLTQLDRQRRGERTV